MRRQTRYTAISAATKKLVWERDNRRCILCGDSNAGPWCHYIPRSKGGLGIEENVVTLCSYHHRILDNGPGRCQVKQAVQAYLQAIYPDWNEDRLVYRKGI